MAPYLPLLLNHSFTQTVKQFAGDFNGNLRLAVAPSSLAFGGASVH